MTARTIDRWATGWGDRLHPVLVKELRASLRAGGHAAVMITVQVLMLALFLVAVNGPLEDRAVEAVLRFGFWAILGVALFIFTPSAGADCVLGEVKGKTWEPLVLTGLSTGGILVAKWLALLSYGFLISVQLLPYFVVRYFFGGVELGSDLLLFFCFCAISAVLAALSVGNSCRRSRRAPLMTFGYGLVEVMVVGIGVLLLFSCRRHLGLSGTWTTLVVVFTAGGGLAALSLHHGVRRVGMPNKSGGWARPDAPRGGRGKGWS